MVVFYLFYILTARQTSIPSVNPIAFRSHKDCMSMVKDETKLVELTGWKLSQPKCLKVKIKK